MTTPDALREALEAIRDLEPRPFDFPADWQAQIKACDECKRYEGHPVQLGICDTHRRPLWNREKHNKHEETCIGYRAKSLARDALALTTTPLAVEDGPSDIAHVEHAIGGLVSIHARLLREIAEAQQAKFPTTIWSEKQAWEDCGSLIEALVELERAKAALASPTPSNIGDAATVTENVRVGRDAEAREVLAIATEKCGYTLAATAIRRGEDDQRIKAHVALAAIQAALAKLSGAGDGLAREALEAITQAGPERDIKWAGMTSRDIALFALTNPPKATCTPPVGEVR